MEETAASSTVVGEEPALKNGKEPQPETETAADEQTEMAVEQKEGAVSEDVATREVTGEGEKEKKGEIEEGEKGGEDKEGEGDDQTATAEERQEKTEEPATDDVIGDGGDGEGVSGDDGEKEEEEEGVGDGSREADVSGGGESGDGEDVKGEEGDVGGGDEVGVVSSATSPPADEVGVVTSAPSPLLPDDEVGVVSLVMSPPDSRLMSASQPPLEDILEEEGEKEEESIDREELISNCREVLLEQRRLRSENSQLQHKIADYLSHKKEEKPDPGRNVTDQEKRYIQCMSALDRLEVELQDVRSLWMRREAEMTELCDRKQRDVHHDAGEFLKYQAEGAKQAVDSRTGRKLTDTDIARLQSAQDNNDLSVFQARLENIKLANKIERLESLLKQKEELAEGLHMIDFEQLKISNVDLGEKVEERNEDIRKLTGKVRATVQVLTHVKEKLHFLQDENEKKKQHLEHLDSDLAKRRDILTRLKQTRDALRADNQRLRQRGGLVGHPDLLRDFEDRQDQNDELQKKLERLQSHHSHNSMQCTGLRRKIERTRHLQHHLT